MTVRTNRIGCISIETKYLIAGTDQKEFLAIDCFISSRMAAYSCLRTVPFSWRMLSRKSIEKPRHDSSLVEAVSLLWNDKTHPWPTAGTAWPAGSGADLGGVRSFSSRGDSQRRFPRGGKPPNLTFRTHSKHRQFGRHPYDNNDMSLVRSLPRSAMKPDARRRSSSRRRRGGGDYDDDDDDDDDDGYAPTRFERKKYPPKGRAGNLDGNAGDWKRGRSSPARSLDNNAGNWKRGNSPRHNDRDHKNREHYDTQKTTLHNQRYASQDNISEQEPTDFGHHPKRMFREDWITQRKETTTPPTRSNPKPKEGIETLFNRSQKGAREKQRETVRLLKKQKRREQRQKTAGNAPVAAATHFPSHERETVRLLKKQKRREKRQKTTGNSNAPITRTAATTNNNFPPHEMNIFVSCLPGLEPILAAELQQLGFDDCSVLQAGGVTPRGSISKNEILQLHLHLGSASHVLIRCGAPFTARGLKELKRKVALLPWHTFLSSRGQTSLPQENNDDIQLQVRITTKKSKLNHKTAVRTAVVDGINDAFQTFAADQRVHHVLEATEESTALPLNVRIDHDEVTISVDSSTTPLHRRGYRLATAKAPLREDLAFALVHSAGWSGKTHDTSQSTPFAGFLDPFCGSGTIAIEAASMALGLPPGRLRPAPLAGTVLHQPRDWRKMVAEKTKRYPPANLPQIAASDRDEGAIAAAKSNAERAGVLDSIRFQCSAIGSHPWLNLNKGSGSTSHNESDGTEDSSTNEEPTGPYPLLVATNPPFGLRIAATSRNKGTRHPLLPLYQTLVGRQDKLSTAGSPITTMTLLHDLNLFRQTGAQDMDVTWSSQHGGISVAAVLAPPPPPTAAAAAADDDGDETTVEEDDNEIAS